MNKSFLLLLAAVSFFVSFSPVLKTTAGKTQPPLVPPPATPTPSAEILRLELDEYEVLIPCYCPNSRDSICVVSEKEKLKDRFLIAVKTIVRNPKKAPLEYQYTVSGGKIVGQGDEVIWNLKGVRPGNYTITTSIKGNRKVSTEMQSQSITVRECDCHCPCECPTLDVSGGGVIKAGETMDFEAHVSGGSAEITYNWTVSQGEIIAGQGTPKITVKTSSEMTGEIKATVEIDGSGLCAECLKTAFQTATITK